MNPKAAQWLLSSDTGISSKTILARLEGGPTVKIGNGNYPHDPADLGRCIRLLNLVPDYRNRLAEMGQVNPVWKNLVAHWAELEKLYCQEDQGQECYLLMQELIKYGEAEAKA
jgi:hypothetical protein